MLSNILLNWQVQDCKNAKTSASTAARETGLNIAQELANKGIFQLV